jgi:hypothetical protein
MADEIGSAILPFTIALPKISPEAIITRLACGTPSANRLDTELKKTWSDSSSVEEKDRLSMT